MKSAPFTDNMSVKTWLHFFILLLIASNIAFCAPSTTFKDKIAQLFIINLAGNETFTPVENITPGGYLLFSYNIADSPKKIMLFTNSIKSYYKTRGLPVPYLATDQEGGLVNRLRGIAGPIPSPKRVAQCLTADSARDLYTMQAKQMRLLGIDMNIAPVVEVLNVDNEQFLGDRSFGDLNTVIKYATAAIRSFEGNGVSCVIKHFPGNTNSDPHGAVSTITYSDDTLQDALAPFKTLLGENPRGVLMSSIIARPIDDAPASLSKKWVDTLLSLDKNRNDLLIFSDDIFMASFQKSKYSPLDAAIAAIKSAVTCIMSSEKRISSLVEKIEEAAKNDSSLTSAIESSYKKVMTYKSTLKEDDSPIEERVKTFNTIMWDDIYLYRKYFSGR